VTDFKSSDGHEDEKDDKFIGGSGRPQEGALRPSDGGRSPGTN
jgi:hypothetical protein